jgi:colicin import membrane protein
MNPKDSAGRHDRIGEQAEPRSVVVPVLVSLSLHLLIIGAMIYVPLNFSAPRLPPGAISVNLISLPGPAPGPASGGGGPQPEKPKPAETPKPAEAPKPQAKPEVSVSEPVPAPKPVPEAPKPEISLTPKVKEKKSLKETTKDSRKMIEQAIDRIEKKVSEPDTRSVATAIERLKKKFGEAEPAPGPSAPAAGQGGASAAAGAGPGGGGGGGGGGGAGQIEPVDIYRVSVASQVERNWAFSPQLAGGDQTLRVGLVFKVLPNGEITDIRYTERSKNSYLDESAYKAIVKSSPVAPHPPMIKAPYVLVAIRFTPEGIR